jgi:phosphoglycerol transferase MdoB-like AlkP superfamily enzyme
MKEATGKRVDSSALFTGLMLIGIGVLFLLDRMNIADFGYVMRNYWALIPAAFGVQKLIQGQIWSGLWLITIGAWLLISHLHLFGLTYGSSWPLLLIALGAGMVVRTVYETARGSEPEEPS